mmetsp:Transcript_24093/g.38717  ORF Transcript_24093/g.38717 Transcript_24093/m.38717 type:complete len:231 (-) Transcript_24093:29-721(-)
MSRERRHFCIFFSSKNLMLSACLMARTVSSYSPWRKHASRRRCMSYSLCASVTRGWNGNLHFLAASRETNRLDFFSVSTARCSMRPVFALARIPRFLKAIQRAKVIPVLSVVKSPVWLALSSTRPICSVPFAFPISLLSPKFSSSASWSERVISSMSPFSIPSKMSWPILHTSSALAIRAVSFSLISFAFAMIFSSGLKIPSFVLTRISRITSINSVAILTAGTRCNLSL